MDSQTWYRPHGTVSHRVGTSTFPRFIRDEVISKRLSPFSKNFKQSNIHLMNRRETSQALLICLFVDGNSFFQVGNVVTYQCTAYALVFIVHFMRNNVGTGSVNLCS